MSQLKQQLQADLKAAMVAKDAFKRDTIRFLMSAIKQIEVDERRELSDEDILKIIQKSIKQREDAITQYKEAGREDLWQKEEAEANILKSYLPKQLTPEELEAEISEIIKTIGVTSMKEMGAVMKEAKEKIGSRSDGKQISEMVKKLLK